nr:cell division protein [Chloromonas rosae]
MEKQSIKLLSTNLSDLYKKFNRAYSQNFTFATIAYLKKNNLDKQKYQNNLKENQWKKKSFTTNQAKLSLLSENRQHLLGEYKIVENFKLNSQGEFKSAEHFSSLVLINTSDPLKTNLKKKQFISPFQTKLKFIQFFLTQVINFSFFNNLSAKLETKKENNPLIKSHIIKKAKKLFKKPSQLFIANYYKKLNNITFKKNNFITINFIYLFLIKQKKWLFKAFYCTNKKKTLCWHLSYYKLWQSQKRSFLLTSFLASPWLIGTKLIFLLKQKKRYSLKKNIKNNSNIRAFGSKRNEEPLISDGKNYFINIKRGALLGLGTNQTPNLKVNLSEIALEKKKQSDLNNTFNFPHLSFTYRKTFICYWLLPFLGFLSLVPYSKHNINLSNFVTLEGKALEARGPYQKSNLNLTQNLRGMAFAQNFLQNFSQSTYLTLTTMGQIHAKSLLNSDFQPLLTKNLINFEYSNLFLNQKGQFILSNNLSANFNDIKHLKGKAFSLKQILNTMEKTSKDNSLHYYNYNNGEPLMNAVELCFFYSEQLSQAIGKIHPLAMQKVNLKLGALLGSSSQASLMNIETLILEPSKTLENTKNVTIGKLKSAKKIKLKAHSVNLYLNNISKESLNKLLKFSLTKNIPTFDWYFYTFNPYFIYKLNSLEQPKDLKKKSCYPSIPSSLCSVGVLKPATLTPKVYGAPSFATHTSGVSVAGPLEAYNWINCGPKKLIPIVKKNKMSRFFIFNKVPTSSYQKAFLLLENILKNQILKKENSFLTISGAYNEKPKGMGTQQRKKSSVSFLLEKIINVQKSHYHKIITLKSLNRSLKKITSLTLLDGVLNNVYNKNLNSKTNRIKEGKTANLLSLYKQNFSFLTALNFKTTNFSFKAAKYNLPFFQKKVLLNLILKKSPFVLSQPLSPFSYVKSIGAGSLDTKAALSLPSELKSAQLGYPTSLNNVIDSPKHFRNLKKQNKTYLENLQNELFIFKNFMTFGYGHTYSTASNQLSNPIHLWSKRSRPLINPTLDPLALLKHSVILKKAEIMKNPKNLKKDANNVVSFSLTSLLDRQSLLLDQIYPLVTLNPFLGLNKTKKIQNKSTLFILKKNNKKNLDQTLPIINTSFKIKNQTFFTDASNSYGVSAAAPVLSACTYPFPNQNNASPFEEQKELFGKKKLLDNTYITWLKKQLCSSPKAKEVLVMPSAVGVGAISEITALHAKQGAPTLASNILKSPILSVSNINSYKSFPIKLGSPISLERKGFMTSHTTKEDKYWFSSFFLSNLATHFQNSFESAMNISCANKVNFANMNFDKTNIKLLKHFNVKSSTKKEIPKIMKMHYPIIKSYSEVKKKTSLAYSHYFSKKKAKLSIDNYAYYTNFSLKQKRQISFFNQVKNQSLISNVFLNPFPFTINKLKIKQGLKMTSTLSSSLINQGCKESQAIGSAYKAKLSKANFKAKINKLSKIHKVSKIHPVNFKVLRTLEALGGWEPAPLEAEVLRTLEGFSYSKPTLEGKPAIFLNRSYSIINKVNNITKNLWLYFYKKPLNLLARNKIGVLRQTNKKFETKFKGTLFTLTQKSFLDKIVCKKNKLPLLGFSKEKLLAQSLSQTNVNKGLVPYFMGPSVSSASSKDVATQGGGASNMEKPLAIKNGDQGQRPLIVLKKNLKLKTNIIKKIKNLKGVLFVGISNGPNSKKILPNSSQNQDYYYNSIFSTSYVALDPLSEASVTNKFYPLYINKRGRIDQALFRNLLSQSFVASPYSLNPIETLAKVSTLIYGKKDISLDAETVKEGLKANHQKLLLTMPSQQANGLEGFTLKNKNIPILNNLSNRLKIKYHLFKSLKKNTKFKKEFMSSYALKKGTFNFKLKKCLGFWEPRSVRYWNQPSSKGTLTLFNSPFSNTKSKTSFKSERGCYAPVKNYPEDNYLLKNLTSSTGFSFKPMNKDKAILLLSPSSVGVNDVGVQSSFLVSSLSSLANYSKGISEIELLCFLNKTRTGFLPYPTIINFGKKAKELPNKKINVFLNSPTKYTIKSYNKHTSTFNKRVTLLSLLEVSKKSGELSQKFYNLTPLNYQIKNKKFIYSLGLETKKIVKPIFLSQASQLRDSKIHFKAKNTLVNFKLGGHLNWASEGSPSFATHTLGGYAAPNEPAPNLNVFKLIKKSDKIKINLQKKRRAVKQRRETNRLLKRNHFFPRPIWLRLTMYRQFLKLRHNPLNHRIKKRSFPLPVRSASWFVSPALNHSSYTHVGKADGRESLFVAPSLYSNLAFIQKNQIKWNSGSIFNKQKNNIKTLNMSLYYSISRDASFQKIKGPFSYFFHSGKKISNNVNFFNKFVLTFWKRMASNAYFPSISGAKIDYNIYKPILFQNKFNTTFLPMPFPSSPVHPFFSSGSVGAEGMRKVFETEGREVAKTIFNEKEFYSISKHVLTDFKQGIWKSSWLRSNLNAYLNKIKQSFNLMRTIAQTSEFNFKYARRNSANYQVDSVSQKNHIVARNINSPTYFFSNLVDVIRTKKISEISNKLTDSWAFPVSPTSIKRNWQFLANIFSQSILTTKYNTFEIEPNVENSVPTLSQSLLKWETSLKKALLSQATFNEIEQIITNIKYNVGGYSSGVGVSNQKNIKNDSLFLMGKTVGDPSYNEIKEKKKRQIWNNACQKLKKPIIKDFSFLNSNFQGGALFTIQDLGNISKQKVYWAINKTNMWLFKNINKKKFLWANQKQREQRRSNKTKNFLSKARALAAKPIEAKYCLETSKNVKLFLRLNLNHAAHNKLQNNTINEKQTNLVNPKISTFTKDQAISKASKSKLISNNNFMNLIKNKLVISSPFAYLDPKHFSQFNNRSSFYNHSYNLFLTKQKQKENKMNYLGFLDSNLPAKSFLQKNVSQTIKRGWGGNNVALFLFSYNYKNIINKPKFERALVDTNFEELKNQYVQLLKAKTELVSKFHLFRQKNGTNWSPVKLKQTFNSLKNDQILINYIDNAKTPIANIKFLKSSWFEKNGILKEHQIFLRHLKNSLRLIYKLNLFLANSSYNTKTIGKHHPLATPKMQRGAATLGHWEPSSSPNIETDKTINSKTDKNLKMKPVLKEKLNYYYSYTSLYNLQKKANGFLHGKSYMKHRAQAAFIEKRLNAIRYPLARYANTFGAKGGSQNLTRNSQMLFSGNPFKLHLLNLNTNSLASSKVPCTLNLTGLNLSTISKANKTKQSLIYLSFLLCTMIFHLCSLFSVTSSAEIRSVIKFFIIFSLKLTYLYLGLTRSIFIYFLSFAKAFNLLEPPMSETTILKSRRASEIEQKKNNQPTVTFLLKNQWLRFNYQASLEKTSLFLASSVFFGLPTVLFDLNTYKSKKAINITKQNFLLKQTWKKNHFNNNREQSLFKQHLIKQRLIGNQAADGKAKTLDIESKKLNINKILTKLIMARAAALPHQPYSLTNAKFKGLLPLLGLMRSINQSKKELFNTQSKFSLQLTLNSVIKTFIKKLNINLNFIKSGLVTNHRTSKTYPSYSYKFPLKILFNPFHTFITSTLLAKSINTFLKNKAINKTDKNPIHFKQKRTKIKDNKLMKGKIISLKLLKELIKFGVTVSYSCYTLFVKSVEIPKTGIRTVYIFLEKPSELLSDWIIQLFLIELASDLTTIIPENTDSAIWNSFTKFAKSSSLLANATILGTLFEKRLFNSFETFLELLSQPDTDLLRRQKKVSYAWDIWGEILKNVAEKNNINISLLTNKKEDQAFLIAKLLEDNQISAHSTVKDIWTQLLSKTMKDPTNQEKDNKKILDKSKKSIKFNTQKQNKQTYGLYPFNFFSKTKFDNGVLALAATQTKQSTVPPGTFSHISPLYHDYGGPFMLPMNQRKERMQIVEKNKSGPIKNLKSKLSWSANQFMTYKGKDSDLFIQAPPAPKSFQISFKTIKHYNPIQAPIGNIICQIYSGIFYKKTAKNFLVVGTSSNNSNYDEKSLLIQSLAGETEMKIIRDNANRYNFTLGIKSLRNVFDALAIHTPCIFLIEDIHVIGERRPLLVGDDENAIEASNRSGSEPNQTLLPHEKNLSIAKLTRHLVMHYKKPFRGDYSNLIPTRLRLFDLFLGVSSPRVRQIGLTPLSPILVEKENQTQSLRNSTVTLKASTLQFSLAALNGGGANSESITNLNETTPSFKKKKEARSLAPPSTSPLTVFLLKEQTKFQPKSTVKEVPWIGFSEQATLSNQLGSKQNYSIRVKISLLAHMAVSNLSVKLNMITDLLVIIDNVRSNRGFVVFATTHTPAILDPALRRPGRLDETIALPFIPKLEHRWEIVKSNVIYYSPSFFSFSSNKSFFQGIPESGFPLGLTVDLLDYGLFNDSLSTLNLQSFKIQEKFTRFKKNQLKLSLKSHSKVNFSYTKRTLKLTGLILQAHSTPLFFKPPRLNETFILDNILEPSRLLTVPQSLKQRFDSQKVLQRKRRGNNSVNPVSAAEVQSTCYAEAAEHQKESLLLYGKPYNQSTRNTLTSVARNKISAMKNGPSTLVAIAYSKIGKLLINNKFAFNYNNLSLFSTLHAPLENRNSDKQHNSPYLHLYTKQENIKQILISMLTTKVTETFAFSALSLGMTRGFNSKNPYQKILSNNVSTFPLSPFALPIKLTKQGDPTGLGSAQLNQAEQSKPNNKIGHKILKKHKVNRLKFPESSSESQPKNSKNKIPIFGLWSLQSIDKTWRAASSIILSYIDKQLIYKKSLVIPKLLQFYNAGNQSSALHDPPSAPSSLVLLPAKRYENYKRSFLAMQNQNASYELQAKPKTTFVGAGSPYEKLELHQKRILKKKLYSLLAISNSLANETLQEHQNKKNTFPKEKEINQKNIMDRSPFSNPLLQTGTLNLENISATLLSVGKFIEKPTSINWYYRNRLLNRHRGYLNNQWWNGQLGEHSLETTFLSDFDWRSNFGTYFLGKGSHLQTTKKELKLSSFNGNNLNPTKARTTLHPLLSRFPFNREVRGTAAKKVKLNLSKIRPPGLVGTLEGSETKKDSQPLNLNLNSEEVWNKKKIEDSSLLDVLIDYPDFDQYYNPRNRRWILNFGYWSYWYDYQKDHNKEIYSYLIMETFLQTYHFLNSNREILDYLVTKFIKLGLLKEITLIDSLKRF